MGAWSGVTEGRGDAFWGALGDRLGGEEVTPGAGGNMVELGGHAGS